MPACDDTDANKLDEDHDMLNVCEEKFLYSKNPVGPTKGWTDELVKANGMASPTNFDSDGDGVLDSLEFFFFRTKGYSTNYNNINSRKNGRTQYDYFKNHQSYLKPESSLPYNISVTWVKKNEQGQNCYRIDQQKLPIYHVSELNFGNAGNNLNLTHGKDENVILVYYLMTTDNDPDGKGVMRYSYQKRSYPENDKVINYNDMLFEEYKAK